MPHNTAAWILHMRELLLMLLPTGMLGLLASEDGMMPVEIPYAQWVQGGAAAVVSGLLVYIIVRYIPELQRQQKEALVAQQRDFSSTLDRMAERFERWETMRDNRDDQLNSTLQSLIAHCAKANREKGQ
jgi:membrane protein implicated in regulation of membrane protease activity